MVEADGSVYPCDFYMLDEYRLGNFNSDRLVEIDEKRKSIAFVEQSQKSAKDCISNIEIIGGGLFFTEIEVKNDNEKFVPSESDKEAIRKNIEEIECLKIQSP